MTLTTGGVACGMKSLLTFIAALCLSAGAWGQRTVNEWRWTDLPPAQLPPGTAVVSANGRAALKVENPKNAPRQFLLLTIDHPKVSAQVYAIKGEIRCGELSGYGILEMWSYFPPAGPGQPEGRDFSRIRIDSSEPGQTRGASDWHPFSIPFNSMGVSTPPDRLQINLLLGGRGTVYLGPLRLTQFMDDKNYVERDLGKVWLYGHTAHPWWSRRAEIQISAVGAGLLLAVGAWIEISCKRGKARSVVAALVKIQISLGVVLGCVTIAALIHRQPFAVWFPLTIFTIILLGVYSVLYLTLDKYYAATGR